MYVLVWYKATEACHEHESKIIHCGDRDWYITASGHFVENGNPIKDIRDIDFSHQNFDCLGFFRNGKRVVMFNDLGEFRLKLSLHNWIIQTILKRNFLTSQDSSCQPHLTIADTRGEDVQRTFHGSMLSSFCRYHGWFYRSYKANATDPQTDR